MNIYKKISISVVALIFVCSVSLQNTFAAGPAGVNLGLSGDFVILSKTGVTTTGATSVVGDVGVSPVAASYITGFALNLGVGSAFATSSLVSGKVYAPGYADPTPVNLSTAVSNMETAYTDAMGRTNPTATELGSGNIGGMTLAPGLYKWSTGVTIPTDVTLSGGANDVWIFQIAQNLNISSATQIILSGGAQAGNIFWIVAGQATLGTTSVFNGTILSQTAIVLNTGAQLYGRALAQTAVTLDSNVVTISSITTSASTSSPISTSASTSTTTSTNGSSSLSSNSSQTVTTATASVVCPLGDIFKATTGERCTSFVTASNYMFGTRLVRQGVIGENCQAWQRFFNDKRNTGLVVDGKCGPLTMAAARTWQASVGLIADGILGIKSRTEARLLTNK